ncbi:hypothetical protein KM043_009106 [Ampulex compressa]|nr:hypothetical protein KM043_009106 [Ampulex compressa]
MIIERYRGAGPIIRRSIEAGSIPSARYACVKSGSDTFQSGTKVARSSLKPVTEAEPTLRRGGIVPRTFSIKLAMYEGAKAAEYPGTVAQEDPSANRIALRASLKGSPAGEKRARENGLNRSQEEAEEEEEEGVRYRRATPGAESAD